MSDRKLTRREFLRLSVIVSSAGFLAACGAPATTSPTQSAPQSTAPAGAPPTAAAGGRTTLTISYPDELGAKPKYVNAAVDAFKAKHPNVDVVVDLQKIPDEQYIPKLLLGMGAGTAPDIFHIGGTNMGGLVDANFIAPLDQYLASWSDWQYFYDSIKQAVKYNGKSWCIPYGLDTRFLYYRKDVFQQAGLNPDWAPKSLDDIVTAAKAVKAKVPNVIPYVTYAGPAGGGGTTSHSWLPILWSEGGDVKNKDGKWIASSQPEIADLQYLKKVFIDEKLVPSEVLTLPKPWTTMRQKMGQGGLAILFEGGWVYGSWSSIASAADLQKNIGTILFPYNNGSGDFTVGGLGTCWYISSQSKNKDLAWDWIATWNNAQTVAKLNIEDPHPVPRSDAADVADFKSNAFLVMCTESLKKARFEPTDANWSKITTSIQQVTGQVASGQLSPEDGQKQLSQALAIIAGSDNVVTQ